MKIWVVAWRRGAGGHVGAVVVVDRVGKDLERRAGGVEQRERPQDPMLDVRDSRSSGRPAERKVAPQSTRRRALVAASVWSMTNNVGLAVSTIPGTSSYHVGR